MPKRYARTPFTLLLLYITLDKFQRVTTKEKATQMINSGATITETAAAFNVHRNTIRNWINPDLYRKNLNYVRAWQAANPWVNRVTQEQRDRQNASNRHRYATDEKTRERFRKLVAKYRRQPQGALGTLVRQITLGHANRFPQCHADFMTAATGMTREQFTSRYSGEGWFDHIVPICAFDLTNPEHLVRCVYPDNVRLIPAKENMSKGKKGGDCDIMSLPWIGTQDALDRAQALITRVLARLQRNG